MLVEDIISELKKFPPKMEVVISDGYKLFFYKGTWIIKEFEGKVDIGVGGTEVRDGEEL